MLFIRKFITEKPVCGRVPQCGIACAVTEERPIVGTDGIRSSVGSEQYKVFIRSAISRHTWQIAGAASGRSGIRNVPEITAVYSCRLS